MLQKNSRLPKSNTTNLQPTFPWQWCPMKHHTQSYAPSLKLQFGPNRFFDKFIYVISFLVKEQFRHQCSTPSKQTKLGFPLPLIITIGVQQHACLKLQQCAREEHKEHHTENSTNSHFEVANVAYVLARCNLSRISGYVAWKREDQPDLQKHVS